MSHKQIVKQLLALMRPLWGIMAVSISARTINLLARIALPALGVWGIIRVVESGVNGLLLPLIGGLVGIAVIKGLFRYLEQYTGHYIAFRLLALLRNMFYDRIVPLAPGALDDLRSGDLSSRFSSDVDRIEPFYAHTIAPAATAVLVPGISLVYLAALNPLFLWVLLPFILLVGIAVPIWTSHNGRGLSEDIRHRSGEVNAHITDSFQGLRDVLIFRYGQRRRKEIYERGDNLAEIQKRQNGLRAQQEGVTRGIIAAGIVVFLFAGSGLVQAGAITVPQLCLAVTVAAFSFTPVTKLTDALADYQEAIAAGRRLFSLTSREPPVETVENPVPVPASVNTLGFDSVGFSYAENETSYEGQFLLHNLSFALRSGEITGLVGGSGAGKSTVLALLLRFYDPHAGRILLNDQDISRFSPSELRDKIAVVPQDVHIFNDSLRENLLPARPKASVEDMVSALRKAHLWEFVRSLPDGLDTVIGEKGRKFSGGQRQRLAIARAFLRNAPIFVLDEPTSNLDRSNEEFILESIRSLNQEKMVLIISHRLSTVRDADRILVLENGQITEAGKHEELLSGEGEYSRLFRRQADELTLQV